MGKSIVILVVLSLCNLTLQSADNNEVDDNLFAEAAQAFFGNNNNNNAPDLSGMVSSFMQSDGAKQMGQMFLGNNGGNLAAQVIQGLGSMMSENSGGGSSNGIDMSMIGTMFNVLNSGSVEETKSNDNQGGFDLSSVIAFATNFMMSDKNSGAGEMMQYLPMIMDFFSSFYGPGADKIAHTHAGHSWFLPPLFEKIHILIDQFVNSNLGQEVVLKMGAEKFVKIFLDESGNFSARKFIDLLENHSFRRHWIKMVTGRLSEGIAYVAQPDVQNKYLTTGEFFINSFLKGISVPNSALFNRREAKKSIPNLLDFLAKKYFDLKLQSREYVLPIIEYFEQLIQLAEKKGFLGRSVSSSELTNTLTETINMEIIEPAARVNRALRFAKNVPKCTGYVLCLANQIGPEEYLNLPGVKKFLTQGASMLGGWYISNYARMPVAHINKIINSGNCQIAYLPECQDFHIEELKVTTEYVHNEL